MRRRAFISLLVGTAAAPSLLWPLAARAQQTDRVRRIGVLTNFAESDPEAQTWATAFQEELQRLEWGQGRNIWIVHRWAGDRQDRLPTYAVELAGMALDVIVAAGSPSLAALHRATRTIPIVFVQVSDPVKLGFVASLARPGGNIAGFVNFEHSIGGKWLELLKDAAPGATRVAVIFDPDNPGNAPYLQAIEAAAPSFGVQLTLIGVRNASEIERAIDAFAHEPRGGLIVLPNGPTILHRDLIIALAGRRRLPAVYAYRVFTRAGGLISYGVDIRDQYRRAAGYVDRILKGAKPGDLPVQLSTKFELVVNLKTMKTLGLTISEPFLQQADEVIE